MTDPSPILDPSAARTDVTLTHLPAWGDHALVVHGGAGPRPAPLTDAERAEREEGLAAALRAGQAVLVAGGSALDAVCASVVALEDCEFFNAGRGAALTTAGAAELDASVMTGAGDAGAVTASTRARNPVLAARAVMERTRHVIVAAPDAATLTGWDCDLADPAEFVVDRQRESLRRLLSERTHGTVGAVARDRHGRLAAATSTGGITGQLPGRVGDTPVVGAGTWADERTAALSGTGQGEFFLRGALAHDVHARMRYAGRALPDAVAEAIAEHLGARGADGGVIAVAPDGALVVARNSAAMYRGWLGPDGPVVLT